MYAIEQLQESVYYGDSSSNNSDNSGIHITYSSNSEPDAAGMQWEGGPDWSEQSPNGAEEAATGGDNSELRAPASIGRVTLAGWNINGLSSYKQQSLLQFIAEQTIDVLCVSETHLVNQEQLTQWERHVRQSGRFIWIGRAAAPARGSGRGRGSGGVGILLRHD